MTIKQLGGVFGRNPTFNNVTIDGELIINGSVFTGLDYEGAWNADTNTPTLTSSVGTLGQFYIVSVAGATDLNGITNWDVGDWALFNGSVWQRVEGGADGNFSTLSVSGLSSLNGGANVTGSVTADGANIDGAVTTGDITIDNDDTPTLNFKKAASADVLGTINVSTDAGTGGKMVFQTKRNGNTAVDRMIITDDGDLSLYEDTGTTPKFFWDASAESLGIGTSSPAYLMHLEDSNGADLALGNSTVSPSAGDYLGRIYALDSTNGFFAGINMFYHDDNDGEMRFRVKTNGTNADVMTLVDGNVLVGKTTSSSATAGHELLDYGRSIHTANRTTVQIVNRLGNDGDISIFQKDGTTVGSIGSSSASGTPILDISSNSSSGIMRMLTSGTERMRIDGGNLLVGTTDTTPYNNNANSTADNGIVAGAGLFAAARYQGSVGLFNRTGNDGEILGFKRSGAAVGSISVAASVTSYNTSSDQRLKENITDADDAGSKIDAIQVRKFDWKVDGSHQDYGMVAQELQTVAPEAVSQGETEDDMMGVDYSKLVPMMLKEIQSLRARISALES